MRSASDNIEIMNHNKADKVIKELYNSLLNTYQTGLEASIKDSKFIFDCVN